MRRLLFLTALGLVACGSRSMMTLASLHSTWHVEFYTDGHTLALRGVSPWGETLVVYPPSVVDARVVMEAGVASAGAGGVHTSCFDVDRLNPPPNWWDRVYWRAPDGSLTRVSGIEMGERAREVIARCPRSE